MPPRMTPSGITSSMETIPLITTNAELYAKVEQMAGVDSDKAIEVIQLAGLDEAVDYLNIELPELVCIDFSADLDAFALLYSIIGDPWLIHGGLIVLCAQADTAQRLEAVHGANIVAVLTTEWLNANCRACCISSATTGAFSFNARSVPIW